MQQNSCTSPTLSLKVISGQVLFRSLPYTPTERHSLFQLLRADPALASAREDFGSHLTSWIKSRIILESHSETPGDGDRSISVSTYTVYDSTFRTSKVLRIVEDTQKYDRKRQTRLLYSTKIEASYGQLCRWFRSSVTSTSEHPVRRSRDHHGRLLGVFDALSKDLNLKMHSEPGIGGADVIARLKKLEKRQRDNIAAQGKALGFGGNGRQSSDEFQDWITSRLSDVACSLHSWRRINESVENQNTLALVVAFLPRLKKFGDHSFDDLFDIMEDSDRYDSLRNRYYEVDP